MQDDFCYIITSYYVSVTKFVDIYRFFIELSKIV